ncbi:MAG TPA: hypothetical protein VFA41_13090 [Ktedonobacteraceae bacterium]|jgi:hypothetical protein|nr:hypothetical protein [Ktedonobacteraceae bacterium]
MKHQQHDELNVRRGAFRSVLRSMKWSLFLFVWMIVWVLGLIVLVMWWQVPPFISLLFCIVEIGLFIYIMVRYVLDSWAGPQIKANFRLLWGKQETALPPSSIGDDVESRHEGET